MFVIMVDLRLASSSLAGLFLILDLKKTASLLAGC